jgi:paraquat-inducible protein B
MGAVDKVQVNAARTLGDIDQFAIETRKQVKTDGGDADTLVTSLSDMTGPRSPMRRDLESTLRDLSASAGSLRIFTRDLERDPLGNIMTKGRAPSKARPTSIRYKSARYRCFESGVAP